MTALGGGLIALAALASLFATGAFVQVFLRERGETERRRVHSGWLFKENPSLNVVEHPIYDVWVKDCAMSFPGDE